MASGVRWQDCQGALKTLSILSAARVARAGKVPRPNLAIQGTGQDGSSNSFAGAGVEQSAGFGGSKIGF